MKPESNRTHEQDHFANEPSAEVHTASDENHANIAQQTPGDEIQDSADAITPEETAAIDSVDERPSTGNEQSNVETAAPIQNIHEEETVLIEQPQAMLNAGGVETSARDNEGACKATDTTITETAESADVQTRQQLSEEISTQLEQKLNLSLSQHTEQLGQQICEQLSKQVADTSAQVASRLETELADKAEQQFGAHAKTLQQTLNTQVAEVTAELSDQLQKQIVQTIEQLTEKLSTQFNQQLEQQLNTDNKPDLTPTKEQITGQVDELIKEKLSQNNRLLAEKLNKQLADNIEKLSDQISAKTRRETEQQLTEQLTKTSQDLTDRLNTQLTATGEQLAEKLSGQIEAKLAEQITAATDALSEQLRGQISEQIQAQLPEQLQQTTRQLSEQLNSELLARTRQLTEQLDKVASNIASSHSAMAANDTAVAQAAPHASSIATDQPVMDITPYLKLMVEKGGSDIYFIAGAKVQIKIDGTTLSIGQNVLPEGAVNSILPGILNATQLADFERELELDTAISLDDVGRFRINVYRQRGEAAIVIRHINTQVPSIKELKLPLIIENLIMEPRGLIIVAGATGTGKSTTMATMIDHRNSQRSGHILTVEDPIEYIHTHKKSIVSQREVGLDTRSFKEALRRAMREAPDVIMIGEIRDAETMEQALSYADTGHLCIATLHATNATQCLERIISLFPAGKRDQLLLDLSLNLRAIIAQRLLIGVNKKRVPATEVLLNEPLIQKIVREGETHKIKDALEKAPAGSQLHSFDNDMLRLYKNNEISLQEALNHADEPNHLKLKVNLGGGDIGSSATDIF